MYGCEHKKGISVARGGEQDGQEHRTRGPTDPPDPLRVVWPSRVGRVLDLERFAVRALGALTSRCGRGAHEAATVGLGGWY